MKEQFVRRAYCGFVFAHMAGNGAGTSTCFMPPSIYIVKVFQNLLTGQGMRAKKESPLLFAAGTS